MDMKIFVKVKTRARQESVEKIDETHFLVQVKAPATEGRANEAVVFVLADYFDIAKSNITILSGHTVRNKVILVNLL